MLRSSVVSFSVSVRNSDDSDMFPVSDSTRLFVPTSCDGSGGLDNVTNVQKRRRTVLQIQCRKPMGGGSVAARPIDGIPVLDGECYDNSVLDCGLLYYDWRMQPITDSYV